MMFGWEYAGGFVVETMTERAELYDGSFGSKNGKKIAGLMGKPSCEDLILLKGLIEERKIKPVIDRRYTLSATRQAFEYLHEGHAKGKIVLTL